MESRDGYNKTHDKAPASSSSHTDAASSMPQPWDVQYHHQELEHKLDIQGQPVQLEEAARQPEIARQLEAVHQPEAAYPDSLLNNIKTSIPEFEGLHDPDLYLDWECKIEKIYDCYDFPKQKKVKLTSLEFRGYVASWWEMQQEATPMFIPVHYERELEKKLTRIKPGMNPDIACEVELKNFTSIEEMVHYASIVERQLREGRRRLHHSSAPNEIESASEDEEQPTVDAKKEPETPPVDSNEEEPELPHRDGRTTKLKLLTPKAVAKDQRLMQERFRAERAKEAAAATWITVDDTHSAESFTKAATSSSAAKAAPKPPSKDSLMCGNSSGSAAKKDQNRNFFISVKDIEKTLKAVFIVGLSPSKLTCSFLEVFRAFSYYLIQIVWVTSTWNEETAMKAEQKGETEGITKEAKELYLRKPKFLPFRDEDQTSKEKEELKAKEEMELKPLPTHLRYAYLDEAKQKSIFENGVVELQAKDGSLFIVNGQRVKKFYNVEEQAGVSSTVVGNGIKMGLNGVLKRSPKMGSKIKNGRKRLENASTLSRASQVVEARPQDATPVSRCTRLQRHYFKKPKRDPRARSAGVALLPSVKTRPENASTSARAFSFSQSAT
ncbi:hypothetical protein C2S52_013497 [Perilla frutescens var. hirtella]|nr:hypothetical protein C2S52_013497 [Perilla frutescens var. hirtella]